MSKLRLEDAEEWLARWERCQFYPFTYLPMLRALIDLYRAAKREVRCTCDDGPYQGIGRVIHNIDCPLHSCSDTAAELERWE